MRKSPNIIVTGTPGVGKTTHCEALAERTGLRHLSVNQIVKEKDCHEGWDDKFSSWIVDEDKVIYFYFNPLTWAQPSWPGRLVIILPVTIRGRRSREAKGRRG